MTQTSASLNVSYALDAAGNHTTDGLKSYEHDAAGRLARLRYLKNGEPMSVVYLHNALGQRVFKSEPVADQLNPDPDTLGQSFIEWLQTRFAWLFTTTRKNDRTKLGTAFVYEGTDLLGEYGTGGANSTGSTEYIYLPTDQGNVLVGAIINGQAYAVHTDHLNTPRLMTDAANQPVWQWGYSAFGDNEPSIAARNFRDRSWAFAKGELKDLADGTDDVDNSAQFGKKMVKMNLRYPGQYFDDESNLHYNGQRSYGPPNGRYTQVDPIGLKGGWNPIVYANQNPLRYIDPWGLDEFPVQFDASSGTLWITPPGSTAAQGFPAGNNTTSSSRGAWAEGTYKYDYSTTHKDASSEGSYGSNGNTVFRVPGCVGCGIHSGRESSSDRRGGSGVNHVTEGCIRTTDDATRLMRDLVRQGHRPLLEVNR